jgi:hypothetical protein
MSVYLGVVPADGTLAAAPTRDFGKSHLKGQLRKI